VDPSPSYPLSGTRKHLCFRIVLHATRFDKSNRTMKERWPSVWILVRLKESSLISIGEIKEGTLSGAQSLARSITRKATILPHSWEVYEHAKGPVGFPRSACHALATSLPLFLISSARLSLRFGRQAPMLRRFACPVFKAAATGQAEAFAAQADDPSAIQYNPAGQRSCRGCKCTSAPTSWVAIPRYKPERRHSQWGLQWQHCDSAPQQFLYYGA
jgi:hypothetical protein